MSRIRHVTQTPIDDPAKVLKLLVEEKVVKAVEVDSVIILKM